MELLFEDINGFSGEHAEIVFEELSDVLNSMESDFETNSTAFRTEFKEKIILKGFSNAYRINIHHSISITSIKKNVGVCLQLGNIARVFYDLLKISYSYTHNNEFQFIIICPLDPNGNRAYYKRAVSEIKDLYSTYLSVPIRIIGISN